MLAHDKGMPRVVLHVKGMKITIERNGLKSAEKNEVSLDQTKSHA